MIRVKLIYFAQAREAAGTSGEDIRLNGRPRVKAVLSKVYDDHPKLRVLEKTLKIAVNEQIIDDNVLVHDGDRIALLPPVVGG